MNFPSCLPKKGIGSSHCLILTLESQLFKLGLEGPASFLTFVFYCLQQVCFCFVPEVFCIKGLFSLLFLVLTLRLFLFLFEQNPECTNTFWFLVHSKKGSNLNPGSSPPFSLRVAHQQLSGSPLGTQVGLLHVG